MTSNFSTKPNLTKDLESNPKRKGECPECRHMKGSHSRVKGCIFCPCEIKGSFRI